MLDDQPATTIYFNSGIPSNFYKWAVTLPHPFTHEPHIYPTNEHRFQAKKARRSEDHDWIASAGNPFEAKRRGRSLSLTTTELYEWDNFRALPAMLEVNLVKFTTSQVCAQWLQQTGDARIVEHRPDAIWGDNMDGTGKNLLGRVLELVRVQLGFTSA